VLVGAHAVLANGGVVAPAGVHMVALAAKRHSVPCVVLVGLHKLSPLFPHDPNVTFNGARVARLWRRAASGCAVRCGAVRCVGVRAGVLSSPCVPALTPHICQTAPRPTRTNPRRAAPQTSSPPARS
jgi:translation initiation factor 2B subunit (eIF-2B alpha/beta/delta family)